MLRDCLKVIQREIFTTLSSEASTLECLKDKDDLKEQLNSVREEIFALPIDESDVTGSSTSVKALTQGFCTNFAKLREFRILANQ